LQDPAYVKYFTVLKSQDDQAKANRLQQKKTRILYGLYLMKKKSLDGSFKQYFTSCLKKEMNTSSSSDNKLVKEGFSFISFVLQEMSGLPDVLKESMEKIIKSLEKIEPGEQPHSFSNESSFNNTRNLLIEMINDDDIYLAKLAYKILFLLGLARSCVDDLLIMSNLLAEEDREEIDLRDEVLRLKKYYEKETKRAQELEDKIN